MRSEIKRVLTAIGQEAARTLSNSLTLRLCFTLYHCIYLGRCSPVTYRRHPAQWHPNPTCR